MILVDREIEAAIAAREIVIDPYDRANLDVNAYTLHLGESALKLRPGDDIIDLSQPPNPDDFEEIDVGQGYILQPKSVVNWLTQESIKLPKHITGEIDGRSTMARYGVMPVVGSRRVKPGSEGQQTLEICNLGERPVKLIPGLAIAKLLFTKSSISAAAGYNGPYRNQTDGRARSGRGAASL